MIATLKKFFAFCSPKHRRMFYESLLLGVLIAACEVIKYPAVSLVLHGFLGHSLTGGTVRICFLLLLGGILIEAALRAKQAMLQCRAGYGECANKRIEIAEKLRFLPMGFFNRKSLGDISSVTTNTMELLGDVATRVVMQTTQGLLNTALIVLMLVIFDWRIGLIALVGILLFAMINARMQHNNEALSVQKIANDTRLIENVLEYIQGISEVKSYGLSGESEQKLKESIAESARLMTDLEFASNRYMPLQNGVLKLTGLGILLASLRFYLDGSMDLVTAVLMMIMAFHAFAGLSSMGAYSALLRMVDLCVTRGQEILSLPSMEIDGEAYTPKTHDIALEEIDFAYESRKVIDGVSLRIPSGTSAAFVGPSGSGKTTLCRLIARFWDVQSGTVRLDQKDVRDYSIDALMENFSFVFQSVYLFHDTVANNIRFGKPDASMEEVIAAAKQACCHDFITALPEGYDTVIGENGASLSGGERQRISIARAIMKDAPVIILDEATANVDPENEKELMEALAALTKEKTVLMIAHRLKTVRSAKQIFVVERGRIAQHGTHEELLREDGIYRRFVEARSKALSWKV